MRFAGVLGSLMILGAVLVQQTSAQSPHVYDHILKRKLERQALKLDEAISKREHHRFDRERIEQGIEFVERQLEGVTANLRDRFVGAQLDMWGNDLRLERDGLLQQLRELKARQDHLSRPALVRAWRALWDMIARFLNREEFAEGLAQSSSSKIEEFLAPFRTVPNDPKSVDWKKVVEARADITQVFLKDRDNNSGYRNGKGRIPTVVQLGYSRLLERPVLVVRDQFGSVSVGVEGEKGRFLFDQNKTVGEVVFSDGISLVQPQAKLN